MNHQDKNRRHQEYNRANITEDHMIAAARILRDELEWKWYAGMNYSTGHWIPVDRTQSYMATEKEIYRAAFETIKLFTDIPFEILNERAEQVKAEYE